MVDVTRDDGVDDGGDDDDDDDDDDDADDNDETDDDNIETETRRGRGEEAMLPEIQTRLTAGQVLVALHACDTATDDAIYTGIRADAKVIITAPCCHKELRQQFDKRAEKDFVIDDVLSHGILRERVREPPQCLSCFCVDTPEGADHAGACDRACEHRRQQKSRQTASEPSSSRSQATAPRCVPDVQLSPAPVTSQPVAFPADVLSHPPCERALELSLRLHFRIAARMWLCLPKVPCGCRRRVDVERVDAQSGWLVWQVFEFVDGQHTAKNLMITALKRDRPLPAGPLRQRLRRCERGRGKSDVASSGGGAGGVDSAAKLIS
eukprot:2597717-Rhodomonas_salina.3